MPFSLNIKKQRKLAGGVFILFLSSCATQQFPPIGDKQIDPLSTTGMTEPIITESEIHDIEKSALSGNIYSSSKLIHQYSHITLNHSKYLFWMRITAQNGYSYDYSKALLSGFYFPDSIFHGDDDEKNTRSIFWLCRDSSGAEEFFKKAKTLGIPSASQNSASCSSSNKTAFFKAKEQFLFGHKKDVEQLALSGDLDASTFLSDFYKFKTNELYSYWLLVAAENGDRNAQIEYGTLLLKSPDILDNQRAFFWLNKLNFNSRRK